MSFGFSFGDIVIITQLTTQLISRVRHADANFREFGGDLELARALFVSIEHNWSSYSSGEGATRLQQNYNATMQTAVTGVRNGLEELQRELDNHTNTRFSRFRFSYRLTQLHRRLQFHMESVQLVVQNMNLMQGNRIEEIMRLIRDAQEEQERENRARQQHPDEYELLESMSSFELQYLPGRSDRSSRTGDSRTSTTRDILIEQWRQRIAPTSPSRYSFPTSIFQETQSPEDTRLHSRQDQSEISQAPLPVVPTTIEENASFSPTIATGTTVFSHSSPHPRRRRNFCRICLLVLGIIILLIWLVNFIIAISVSGAYDHLYGSKQFFNIKGVLPE